MDINTDIVSIRKGAPGLDETNVLNETGHKNMLHLIHLRWLAVGGQIATIMVATWGFGIQLPMFNMLAVMVCLIAFNLGSHLRWHEERVVSNRELFLAMLIDIASLTAQLYFTGGINNSGTIDTYHTGIYISSVDTFAGGIVNSGVIENYLLTQLRQHAPGKLRLVALLDREDARTVDIAADFRGFKVADGTFAGYGLEHEHRFGNLPYIGRVE